MNRTRTSRGESDVVPKVDTEDVQIKRWCLLNLKKRKEEVLD